MPWRAAFVLCLLATCARGEPSPAKPADENARKEAVLNGFYEAIQASAQAHASDSYVESMLFLKMRMEKDVIRRIQDASTLDPKPDEYEVRGILARRKASDFHAKPCSASYRSLTCLFAKTKAWMRKKDPTKPQVPLWVQEPLTAAMEHAIWKGAAQSERESALVAHYGRLFGKEVKTSTKDCARCAGSPHDTFNKTGKIFCSREDLDFFGCTCDACMGVGVMMTVEFR